MTGAIATAIEGGRGKQTIDGGPNADYILVRDGDADDVTCGSGNDVVLADPSDVIAADCERRIVRRVAGSGIVAKLLMAKAGARRPKARAGSRG